MCAHASECEKLLELKLYPPKEESKAKNHKVQCVSEQQLSRDCAQFNVEVLSSFKFPPLGGPIGAAIGTVCVCNKCSFLCCGEQEVLPMMQLVGLGIKLPAKQAISGRILNVVYESEKQKFANTMKDKLVTLVFDGWSNLANELVLGIMRDNQLIASIDTTD